MSCSTWMDGDQASSAGSCEVTLISHYHRSWQKCGLPVVAGQVPGKPKSVAVCAHHEADRIRLGGRP